MGGGILLSPGSAVSRCINHREWLFCRPIASRCRWRSPGIPLPTHISFSGMHICLLNFNSKVAGKHARSISRCVFFPCERAWKLYPNWNYSYRGSAFHNRPCQWRKSSEQSACVFLPCHVASIFALSVDGDGRLSKRNRSVAASALAQAGPKRKWNLLTGWVWRNGP